VQLPPLDAALAACTAMRHLCLAQCGLPAVPAVVGGFVQLEALLLSDNRIAVLPPAALAALTALQELDVSNNALTALPPQLALLPHLRSVSVSGNILRTLRRSVLDRGTPALLDYLRTRLPAADAPPP
jgi:Leucine-rich repeat (LRR) protein